MNAIKLQVFEGDRPNIDLRGSEPNDTHRTIAEIDPASDEQVQLIQEYGPKVNELLSHLIPSNEFAKGLNLGVFLMDGDGRA